MSNEIEVLRGLVEKMRERARMQPDHMAEMRDEVHYWAAELAAALCAKQAVGEDGRTVADMFWAAGDGERSYFSIEEAVDEALDNDARPGDTIRLDCAKRLPEITVRILEGGDYEVIEGGVK